MNLVIGFWIILGWIYNKWWYTEYISISCDIAEKNIYLNLDPHPVHFNIVFFKKERPAASFLRKRAGEVSSSQECRFCGGNMVSQKIPNLTSLTSSKVLNNKNMKNTLQGTNISHLGKRKIIFNMPFFGDMLVPIIIKFVKFSSCFGSAKRLFKSLESFQEILWNFHSPVVEPWVLLGLIFFPETSVRNDETTSWWRIFCYWIGST